MTFMMGPTRLVLLVRLNIAKERFEKYHILMMTKYKMGDQIVVETFFDESIPQTQFLKILFQLLISLFEFVI